LIGALPYLPRDWTDDPARRAAAGIDETVEFKTKPALARQLLADLHAAGQAPPWATGDEVYGRDTKLRHFCGDHDIGYVFEVDCAFRVALTSGRRVRADQVVTLLRPDTWNHRSAGPGSKGERTSGWAWVATTGERHHLLIRRSLTAPTELADFYTWVPDPRPAPCPRWCVWPGCVGPLEDFQTGKGHFGLDHSQMRLHTALRRHVILTMAALAICLVTDDGIAAVRRAGRASGASAGGHANTFNLGADLCAMAASRLLLVPVPQLSAVVGFAGCWPPRCGSSTAVRDGDALSLVAHLGVLAVVHVPWSDVARHTFVPTFTLDREHLAALIFGTTISPYPFFLHAAEEMEMHDDAAAP
jgi:hypothetical protein